MFFLLMVQEIAHSRDINWWYLGRPRLPTEARTISADAACNGITEEVDLTMGAILRLYPYKWAMDYKPQTIPS